MENFIFCAVILIHYKTERQKSKPKPEHVTKVYSFYDKDHISRILPYKNLTKRIQYQSGNFEHVAVRVKEITLKKAHQLFAQQHPEVKICCRQFESLKLKTIRLKSNANCLVCCCNYHTNIKYIRKPLNHLLILNEKYTLLQNNDLLMSIILYNSKLPKCVFGLCSKFKTF